MDLIHICIKQEASDGGIEPRPEASQGHILQQIHPSLKRRHKEVTTNSSITETIKYTNIYLPNQNENESHRTVKTRIVNKSVDVHGYRLLHSAVIGWFSSCYYGDRHLEPLHGQRGGDEYRDDITHRLRNHWRWATDVMSRLQGFLSK